MTADLWLVTSELLLTLLTMFLHKPARVHHPHSSLVNFALTVMSSDELISCIFSLEQCDSSVTVFTVVPNGVHME
jgi:hypothetical protein